MELLIGTKLKGKPISIQICSKKFIPILHRFVSALQHVDLASKFDEAGKLAKADIDVIVNKFEELKIFASEQKTSSLKATKVAAGKLLKSLLGAFKDLREASDDAAEERLVIMTFRT